MPRNFGMPGSPGKQREYLSRREDRPPIWGGFIIAVVICAVLFIVMSMAVLVASRPAGAHGSEQWIADDKLTDAEGKTCCGPTDCHRIDDDAITPAGDVVLIQERNESAQDAFPVNQIQYVSRDGLWHRCGYRTGNAKFDPDWRFTEKTKCLIGPPKMGLWRELRFAWRGAWHELASR